jgi:hypothetical protein
MSPDCPVPAVPLAGGSHRRYCIRDVRGAGDPWPLRVLFLMGSPFADIVGAYVAEVAGVVFQRRHLLLVSW